MLLLLHPAALSNHVEYHRSYFIVLLYHREKTPKTNNENTGAGSCTPAPEPETAQPFFVRRHFLFTCRNSLSASVAASSLSLMRRCVVIVRCGSPCSWIGAGRGQDGWRRRLRRRCGFQQGFEHTLGVCVGHQIFG